MSTISPLSIIVNGRDQALLCAEKKWEALPDYVFLSDWPSPGRADNCLAYDQDNQVIGDYPRSSYAECRALKSIFIGYFTSAKGIVTQGTAQVGLRPAPQGDKPAEQASPT